VGHFQQRLAWVVLLALLTLGGLLAVPQARAAVLKALRIGAIQIFVTEPRPTAGPATVATPLTGADAATPVDTVTAVPPTATATLAPLTAMMANLAGATTLSEAQALLSFPIRLPTYPADLGRPDMVFIQEMNDGEPVVILVWLEPDNPEEVRLSLYQIGNGDFAFKQTTRLVQETTVNGEWAIWVEGPHLLQLIDDQRQPWLFVEGNVLIWAEENITYRLESGLSLAEAVRIAESLALPESRQGLKPPG
jgi:hypothetical protein